MPSPFPSMDPYLERPDRWSGPCPPRVSGLRAITHGEETQEVRKAKSLLGVVVGLMLLLHAGNVAYADSGSKHNTKASAAEHGSAKTSTAAKADTPAKASTPAKTDTPPCSRATL